MNFRRGMFRMWLVLSVLWVAIFVILAFYQLTADDPGDAVIPYVRAALVPPAILFVSGWLVSWIWKGFTPQAPTALTTPANRRLRSALLWGAVAFCGGAITGYNAAINAGLTSGSLIGARALGGGTGVALLVGILVWFFSKPRTPQDGAKT